LIVVQQARGAVEDARLALAAVEGEIAHRGTLPPRVTEAEDRARAEHQQRLPPRAAPRRATKTSAAALHHHVPLLPPPDLRSVDVRAPGGALQLCPVRGEPFQRGHRRLLGVVGCGLPRAGRGQRGGLGAVGG
ncbi:hypothetical protein, partial [Streptomyces sp. SP17BM10]|uniref:hypothetical protein n=1 Tax=Streptomyces sp. SP17BM10 TaxID=3002530 RepID=UPI002E7A3325